MHLPQLTRTARTGVRAVLPALLAFPLLVSAQVMRCTDPATGKVTYTNAECERGTASKQVEARKSAEQIQQEREQAAQALAARRERDQAESHSPAQPRGGADNPRTATAAGSDPAYSVQCQQARRALQEVNASLGRGMYDEQSRLDQAQRQADLACLSPAAYSEAERSRSPQRTAAYPTYPYYTPPVVVAPRPPRPQPAPAITNCNVFRCYDGKGNTYPR